MDMARAGPTVFAMRGSSGRQSRRGFKVIDLADVAQKVLAGLFSA